MSTLIESAVVYGLSKEETDLLPSKLNRIEEFTGKLAELFEQYKDQEPCLYVDSSVPFIGFILPNDGLQEGLEGVSVDFRLNANGSIRKESE